MPQMSIDPARFHDQPLLLAACIIGGEVSEGDHVVMCDGLRVGRITRTPKSFGRVSWDWTLTGPYLPREMGVGNGSAASKDDAKAAVRAVFDRWVAFYSVNPGQAVWHG